MSRRCRSSCACGLRLLLALASSSLAAGDALAADQGVIGPTYAIAEPHLLEFIQQKLRDKERSGELQRLMEDARRRGIATVQNPPPVEGLKATQKARSFYVDPSFVLDRNLMDAHQIRDTTVNYIFDNFLTDKLYVERPEPVVLTNVLPDEVKARLLASGDARITRAS